MAARTKAWVAVGPVNNMSKPINNNLTVTKDNPELNINPSNMKPAASVSIKLAACILVKKSGMRISPTAPIKQNNEPINKKTK